MVTVDFPVPAASASRPGRQPCGGDVAGATDFEAVFLHLRGEPALAGHTGPAPCEAEAPATSDVCLPEVPLPGVPMARATEDDLGEAISALNVDAAGFVLPVWHPAGRPAVGEPTVVAPAPGDEGPVAPAGARPSTDPSVETPPTAPARLAAAPQAHALAEERAVQVQAVPPPSPADGAPSLPANSPPANAAEDGPAGMVPPADPSKDTGLFVRVSDTGTTAKGPAVQTGMPAYWAAREASDGGPDVADSPSSPSSVARSLATRQSGDQTQSVPSAASADDVGRSSLPEAGMPRLQAPASGPTDVVTLSAAMQAAPPQGPQTLQTPQGLQGPQPLQHPLAPPNPPELSAHIVTALAARPERPLEVRLAPVELGGLILNLHHDGEILHVTLQADRPDTLDLLRRNGDLLLAELRLSGFAGATLSFADGSGAEGRQGSAPPRPAADLPATSGVPQTVAPVPVERAAQGLDLRL